MSAVLHEWARARNANAACRARALQPHPPLPTATSQVRQPFYLAPAPRRWSVVSRPARPTRTCSAISAAECSLGAVPTCARPRLFLWRLMLDAAAAGEVGAWGWLGLLRGRLQTGSLGRLALLLKVGSS